MNHTLLNGAGTGGIGYVSQDLARLNSKVEDYG